MARTLGARVVGFMHARGWLHPGLDRDRAADEIDSSEGYPDSPVGVPVARVVVYTPSGPEVYEGVDPSTVHYLSPGGEGGGTQIRFRTLAGVSVSTEFGYLVETRPGRP